jgi:hypothetical protein
LVSNPGGVGLLGSVERCFELGGWDVAAVAVQPFVVEPVEPGEGGELELVDVLSRSMALIDDPTKEVTTRTTPTSSPPRNLRRETPGDHTLASVRSWDTIYHQICPAPPSCGPKRPVTVRRWCTFLSYRLSLAWFALASLWTCAHT